MVSYPKITFPKKDREIMKIFTLSVLVNIVFQRRGENFKKQNYITEKMATWIAFIYLMSYYVAHNFKLKKFWSIKIWIRSWKYRTPNDNVTMNQQSNIHM